MRVKSILLSGLRQASALTLRGNQFYCPLCEGRYRKFLPAGVIPRPNARCPGCDSLERHRLLWLTLKVLWETCTITKGGRMLHVAPEEAIAHKLQQDYDYLSVDLDGNNVMQAMDIRAINLPDDRFDAIVCNHVLEHIPEDRKALAELYRVLKPGGWASIQVPIVGEITQEDLSITDPKERERLYGQFDHVRQYGKDFKLRLEEAGFKVLIIPKAECLSPDILEKLSVECETEVWICLKNYKTPESANY